MKLLAWLWPKKTRFVSQTDQFLKAFDQAHPERSESQIQEIAKHRDIFHRSEPQ